MALSMSISRLTNESQFPFIDGILDMCIRSLERQFTVVCVYSNLLTIYALYALHEPYMLIQHIGRFLY